MRHKNWTIGLAAAAVSLLALTACSPSPEDDWTTTLKPRWTVDATLVSEPFIAGDTVLAYVHEDDDTQSMVAWDRDDGSELWRTQALPGRGPRGIDHKVAAIQKDGAWQVAYLAQRDPADPPNSWKRLAVADVRTGAELLPQLRETAIWSERPQRCQRDSAFCIDNAQVKGLPDTAGLFTLIDGVLSIDTHPGAAYNQGGRLVSTHVSLSFGDTTTVRYGLEGAYTWWRPYEDVFGPDSDSSGGWAWHEDDDEKLPLIGWGGDGAH